MKLVPLSNQRDWSQESPQTLVTATSCLVWEFSVPGEPKGQPRAKAFARKMGSTYVARVYNPGTAEAWKSAIAIAVREHGLAGRMLTGPVRLRMSCHFQRPKSHFGAGKNAAHLKAGAPQHHLGKPDLDNVVKAAKDAMTQLGVWRDDSQVIEEILAKGYSTGAAFTRFEIGEKNL